jgi:DNA-directed RNA polymerase specialized sigma24 family protein
MLSRIGCKATLLRAFGKSWSRILEWRFKMPAVNEKAKREDLYREILDTLKEWPRLDRQIFAQAHYHGQSIEAISRSLNLDLAEARLILQLRDRELYAALRKFRENSCGESLPTVTQPAKSMHAA